jgi:ketosteroid isomerase-like protein
MEGANMRIRRPIGPVLSLMVAISLAACAKPAAPVDKAKIAADIKADWAKVTAAYNAGDADGTVASDAPDIVNMIHGQANYSGVDEDLKTSKQLFATGPTKEVFSNESVDVSASGDMAVYRATYAWSYTDPNTKQPVTENGNEVAGYRKQADGTWKIEWTITADTPATATTVAAND